MEDRQETVESTTAFDWGEPISVYTRAQAIEDGCLVDVTETAAEAGWRWPVAVTRAVWEACCEWNDEDTERQTHQDVTGRLWDVVYMGMIWVKKSVRNESTIPFSLLQIPRGGKARKPKNVVLKAAVSGGDNGEPVVTILFPDED